MNTIWNVLSIVQAEAEVVKQLHVNVELRMMKSPTSLTFSLWIDNELQATIVIIKHVFNNKIYSCISEIYNNPQHPEKGYDASLLWQLYLFYADDLYLQSTVIFNKKKSFMKFLLRSGLIEYPLEVFDIHNDKMDKVSFDEYITNPNLYLELACGAEDAHPYGDENYWIFREDDFYDLEKDS